jgi:hypothetical protein
MKTKHLIVLSAEFDDSDKRDIAYDNLKSYVSENKSTDSMTLVTITKTEITKPESSSETI